MTNSVPSPTADDLAASGLSEEKLDAVSAVFFDDLAAEARGDKGVAAKLAATTNRDVDYYDRADDLRRAAFYLASRTVAPSVAAGHYGIVSPLGVARHNGVPFNARELTWGFATAKDARYPVTPEDVRHSGALGIKRFTLDEKADVIECVGLQLRTLRTAQFNDNIKGKFISPLGQAPDGYIHPLNREALLDTGKPLLLTEGLVKRDAILSAMGMEHVGVIAYTGVSIPAERRGVGCVSLRLGSILDRCPQILRGRDVFLAFDGDATENSAVARAVQATAVAVGHHGAIVRVIQVPKNTVGSGIDDYLAASHGIGRIAA
ncbi:hypothetical protein C5B85_10775 [Pseudoclavibacter sp. AY1F1]|uniref:DUF3854 domain-containing protein n=1 Tax=Pseudoclavibacter sp. AY1F1 TaxID=2080583 RepID=UPI000CE81EE3|nr:DUF3854 domain-containing protein [Pseudoclavibacter sp. AY1F1]PPF44121.1 hypothetical protein C5B85_10775 [Pseudoclavibacter sp. AY1F1]